MTDGSFIEYFPTGDIKTNGFKEGKYHAVWKIWNKDKQLNFQFSFNEGRLDGIVQKWNDNGNLAFEGELIMGKEMDRLAPILMMVHYIPNVVLSIIQ